MENFRWKSDGTLPPPEVTERFRLSNELAPRLQEVRHDIKLPIIDLAGEDEAALAAMMAIASEEFGFFRIINHGIPEEVWLNAAESVRDFFLLPPEIKSQFPGEEGPIDAVKVYSYFLNDDNRRVDMWSEVVQHLWHPSDDFVAAFPLDIPVPNYGTHVTTCAREMGLLMTKLFRLLSIGLGLDADYLKTKLGDQPFYKCHGNYYPRCPDPNLTIGLPKHSDSIALTVVRSTGHVPGLQILLDDQDWVAVDNVPDSFIVNIGDQLEVLSNRRYKSVFHRVVNNEASTRVSLAYFWGPSLDVEIGPIPELVDEQHPPTYKSYLYKDFLERYLNMKGKRLAVKELYRINPQVI